MRIARTLIVVSTILAIVGCGGGGGGTGTNGGGGGTAKVTITPANPTVAKGGLVSFTGTISTGGPVTWSSTQGAIAKTGNNTATYTAPNQGGIYEISATSVADSTVFNTTTVNVTDPNAPIVHGFVYQVFSTSPAQGIGVTFYDVNGTQVGSITSLADGSFNGEPPVTAVKFSLNTVSLTNNGYNAAFSYNSKGYSTLVKTCTAPLPTLTKGQITNLPGGPIYVYPSTTVPPPPDGCK